MYLQKTIIKKSNPKPAQTLLLPHFVLSSDSRQIQTFLLTGTLLPATGKSLRKQEPCNSRRKAVALGPSVLSQKVPVALISMKDRAAKEQFN